MKQVQEVKKKKSFKNTLYKQRYLIVMALPFVIWVIVFNYLPLWGWTMAFQDYKPRPGLGILDYPFVGLKHFKELFKDPMFYRVMYNTLGMSFLQLIFGFPLPIIFAIFLNELRGIKFKKIVQTVSYLPHFVSWVIVAGLFYSMLKLTESGNIDYKNAIGLTGEVYIPIPENKSGLGKIQITIQDSLKEVEAMTKGEYIGTGNFVKVTGLVNNILVVEKLD